MTNLCSICCTFMKTSVEELSIDSVLGVFRTINITHMHSVSTEGNGDSKIDTRFFISSLIGLKFCIRLEVDNMQNRAEANFEFRPLKNLAPL